MHVGICGEHGGDPVSVEFCHKIGLDYVSCSPFRVPIARLAAAQAAIKGWGGFPLLWITPGIQRSGSLSQGQWPVSEEKSMARYHCNGVYRPWLITEFRIGVSLEIVIRLFFIPLFWWKIPYILKAGQEVHPMLKKKHYLYLNEAEHSILVKSLVEMKNKLTQQGRFTDCVDDLLMKVIAAPMKRF